tara:strand:+ start:5369 stop:6274 length:906 start_codon:yes stop_codon:yes gene_type:complete
MNFKKIINNLITTSMIIFFVYYFYQNRNLISTDDFNFVFIIPIIIFSIGRYFINALIDIKLLQNFDVSLSFSESLNLTVLNTFGNLIAPLKVGSGIKIAYLKSKHKLSIYKYLIINTQYSFLYLALSGFLLFFVIFIYEEEYENQAGILLFIFSALIILFFIFVRRFNFENKKDKYNKYFYDFISMFNFTTIRLNIKNIILFSLLHLFFGFMNIFLIFLFLKFDNKFLESLYFNLITNLSSIVTLTPGNIGLLEIVHILFKELYTLTTFQVIIVSVASRVSSLTSLLMLNIYLRLQRQSLI